jgi:hypothetical protein
MGPHRAAFAAVLLPVVLMASPAVAQTIGAPSTQPGATVTVKTPTGGVTAVGCTSVAFDPTGMRTAGTPATAECPPTSPPSKVEPYKFDDTAAPKSTRWYGWQTLTLDGAALLMTTFGASNNRDASALLWAALGTYALGGPLVHAAHEAPGKAGASLLLRVGAPIVLGYAGYAASSKGSWDDGVILTSFGVLAGLATAITVDAAVLAREKVEPPAVPASENEEPKTGAVRKNSVRVSATFIPTRNGGTVGAVGTF